MQEIPAELRYTAEHEWIRLEADGSAVVGITSHAQHQLGELVYVELPAAGQKFLAGQACAVVESVKAASDVYAPLSGEILAVNDSLSGDPGLVNTSPYEDGWLFRLRPSAASEVAALLDAAAYGKLVAAEA